MLRQVSITFPSMLVIGFVKMLGSLLREARKSQGKTLRQVAENVGSAPSRILLMEQNRGGSIALFDAV